MTVLDYERGDVRIEEYEPIDLSSLLHHKGVSNNQLDTFLKKDIVIMPERNTTHLVNESKDLADFLLVKDEQLDVAITAEKERPHLFLAGYDVGLILVIKIAVLPIVTGIISSWIYDKFVKPNRIGNVSIDFHIKDEKNNIIKSLNIFGPADQVSNIIRELKEM